MTAGNELEARAIIRSLYYIICFLVGFFLISPILLVIPMSFSSVSYLQFPPPGYSWRWYIQFFTDPAWLQPAIQSFQIAILTMLLATVLGTLASFGLVRGKFFGRQALFTLLISPMIVPIIIVAVAVYAFFSRLHLTDTLVGVVIGHTIVAVPFVILAVSASLRGFDENMERAARVLGASPLKTFFKVTFPLIKPGVISGAMFAFIRSFDETVVSIFLCSIEVKTLPKRMWEGIRTEVTPIIASVSTLLIFFSLILLIILEIYRVKNKKKMLGT
jgi:putative spermidine/putrescine transport system permease protein